jgi:hypothetical protein
MKMMRFVAVAFIAALQLMGADPIPFKIRLSVSIGDEELKAALSENL